jgi:hypothetical protein
MQFQAVLALEEAEKAKDELDVTLKLVKKYSDSIEVGDPFRPFMDIIVKKCPIQYNDLVAGEGTVELTYDKIVELHSRVIYATMDYSRSRCLYDEHLKAAYTLEDKIKSEMNVEKKNEVVIHTTK